VTLREALTLSRETGPDLSQGFNLGERPPWGVHYCLDDPERGKISHLDPVRLAAGVVLCEA
jgi:hypothetical protein